MKIPLITHDSPTSVYQYFQAQGKLLYVGVTGRGLKRSHEHAKSKVWWPLVCGCVVEHYETRKDALARESYLIAAEKPPYNTQGISRTVGIDVPVFLAGEHAVRIRGLSEQQETLTDESLFTSDESLFTSITYATQNRQMSVAVGLWMRLSKQGKIIYGCVRCRGPRQSTGASCESCYNHSHPEASARQANLKEIANRRAAAEYLATAV